jgi:hypothetical protein
MAKFNFLLSVAFGVEFADLAYAGFGCLITLLRLMISANEEETVNGV